MAQVILPPTGPDAAAHQREIEAIRRAAAVSLSLNLSHRRVVAGQLRRVSDIQAGAKT